MLRVNTWTKIKKREGYSKCPRDTIRVKGYPKVQGYLKEKDHTMQIGTKDTCDQSLYKVSNMNYIKRHIKSLHK